MGKQNTFIKLKMALTLLVFTLLPLQIHASGVIIDGGDSGLNPIELPTFLNLDQIRSFSIFSYVALIINLIFIALVLTWVVLAINAAYTRLRSEGSEEMITSSTKRFQRIFTSISMLFIFFIIVTLASSFLGFGSIFEWPKQFSYCRDGSYYFTVQLELAGTGASADNACFNTSGASAYCQVVRDKCISRCGSAVSCHSTCQQDYGKCVSTVTGN